MRIVACTLIALFVGMFFGMWYGSRERTCAVIPSNAGTVVLCSNSWKDKIEQ